MKKNGPYALLLATTIITLLGRFNSTLGDGIFNNIANAKLIQSSSIVPTDGNYVFTNLGTAQTVQHDRKNDVPNIFTSSDGSHPGHHNPRFRARKTPGDDELVAAPLELRSHGTRTKWISIRTTATSGDPKCISAQWGYHTEGGADHAGTLYECVVDPLNLAAPLEKPKQWWLLLPVEAAKKLSTAQTLDLKNEILSQNKEMKMKEPPIVSRIVEEQGKGGFSAVDPLDAPFWNPKTNRIEDFSSSSSSGAPSTKNKRFYDHSGELSRANQLSLLRKRQLQDKLPISHLVNSTRDAAAGPQALNAIQGGRNHVDDLNNGAESLKTVDTRPIPWTMFNKRSPKHHAKSVSKAPHTPKEAKKPATGALGPFYVISVDHLYDMETRVWTSAVKTTVGNQLSLVLQKLDPNDTTQQWYLKAQA